MTNTIVDRFARAISRLEGLSTTPVKASFSLSPDILGMLDALSPSQPEGKVRIKGKTKETLDKVVLEYVINTVGTEVMPLNKVVGIDRLLAGYGELEQFFQEEGLSKDQAAEARWYLERAYETPEDLLVALRKSMRRGGEKIVKTFFMQSCHKELIDRYARAAGMDKSSFLEFLIRTYWSRMRGRWHHRLFECYERIAEAKVLLESVVRDIREDFSAFTPFEQNGFPDPSDFEPPGQDLIVAGVSNLIYLTKCIDDEVLYYFAEAFLSATDPQVAAKKK